MNRRNFIQTAGLLGTTALLSNTSCMKPEPKSYKLGLQLYSINGDMNKDTLGTLKAVKAMGYQDFEAYGFDGPKGTYYNLPAETFKGMLDDLELTATSCHYGFSSFMNESDDTLKRFVDQCIKGAKITNMPYVTWPWLAPELRTIENYKLMVEKLNLIGDQVAAAGLGFAYHNHGFEFEDHNGENGYDLILNGTDPDKVKLQMDMYWVMHAGTTTPKELIAQHPGRYVMWHIKDMDKATRDYTEMGNGSIDYVEILPDPVKSGLEYYYIEQGGNFTESPLQSAATSAKYFKEHLQELL